MKIEFTAFPRTAQGTGASRRMRGAGKVPGIVYGADQPAQPIELDHHALSRHLKMEAFHASILDMTLEGAKQQVLLRDVQIYDKRGLPVLYLRSLENTLSWGTLIAVKSACIP